MLKKFGETLTSRQLGKEAILAFQSSLQDLSTQEIIVVDFEGVGAFSPSWADEFLSPLVKKYKKRFLLKSTDNISVKRTLGFLERINNYKFNIQE